MASDHYKEICFAMALRKIERGKLYFFFDQIYDNMETSKLMVNKYNGVVKDWILLANLVLVITVIL